MRVALLLTLLGCSSLSAEKCGDVTLCESAFTVTIQPNGASFAPDFYTLEVRADDARIDYECVIREPGTGSSVFECLSNHGDSDQRVAATLEDFAVTAIRVKTPAARRVTVALRAHCPARGVAAQTFEPQYNVTSDDGECETCRTASATLIALPSSGAFIVCPDSGVAGD
jgi:hypothetical protein